jgi:ribosomal protein L37AE/L43A
MIKIPIATSIDSSSLSENGPFCPYCHSELFPDDPPNIWICQDCTLEYDYINFETYIRTKSGVLI